MGNFGVTPTPEAGLTKHENPLLPPFGKGGMSEPVPGRGIPRMVAEYMGEFEFRGQYT